MRVLSLILSKSVSVKEDEISASQKESEFRYCHKHERFYKADIGCHICDMKKQNILNLIECPRCGEKSLFWIKQVQAYECFNSRCRMSYTKEQYNKSLQYDNQTLVSLDSEVHIPTFKNTIITRARQELANEALAAEKEIMHVLENLNSELYNAEIHV